MSKNEHIYSYVERKIIDGNIKHTFDEKRYKVKNINTTNNNKSSLKALLIGAALGFIVVVILILRDLYILKLS